MRSSSAARWITFLIDPSLPPLDFAWSTIFPWGTNDYLGVTLANLQITLNGQECLLLYDPGTFSPFEHFGGYPVTSLPAEQGNTAVILVDKGALDDSGTALAFRSFSDEDWVRLDYSSSDFRDPGNKYPLSYSYPEMYGPYGGVSSGDLP